MTFPLDQEDFLSKIIEEETEKLKKYEDENQEPLNHQQKSDDTSNVFDESMKSNKNDSKMSISNSSTMETSQRMPEGKFFIPLDNNYWFIWLNIFLI